MANYDAEATGRLLFIFIKDVAEKHGVTNLKDLNIDLIDENSYKKARVKHATLYVKNQTGLKNMFKLVSLSGTKYFEGVPRIPKTVLDAHREGLILGSACSEGEVFDAVMSQGVDAAVEVAKYYDFISVGSTRIADRPCEVLRVVARDGSRYSYIVWMDEDTKLPLRVDLLDRDGETLEQYRVISFAVGADVQGAMQGLLKANLPPLLSLPAVENVKLSWSTGWLPAGVDEVARNRRKLPNVAVPVESRLYSDGLFSFSVNVSPAGSGAGQQYYRQGRRTIQTEVRAGNEITIVGELPPATAKRIADSISFKVSPQ